MRKFLPSLLCLFLLLIFSSRVFAGPFSDVPEGHWAYKALQELQEKGAITGIDGKFFGKKPITRYEMAVLIEKIIQIVEKGQIKRPVCDVCLTWEDILQKRLNEREEFKDMIGRMLKKLEVEFKDELEMLGVRVTTLEDKTTQMQNDIASVKKFQWWGFIRVRGWLVGGGWNDIFSDVSKNTYMDQLSVLSTRVNVNKDTQVNISLSNRDFKQFNLGGSGFSNVIYSGWGDEENAKGFTVYRAYVTTQTKLAKFTVGRQHWKWGPYGLLVMSPLKGAFGNGAALVEKQTGKIKLSGIASMLPGHDKYAAARAAIPVKNGEFGLTYMPLGPGAVKNSFGADISLGKFKAEAALLSYDKNTEPDNALGVVAGYDVIKNEKNTVNIKLASIDGQSGDKASFDLKIPGTTRTLSIIGEEDAEGVFRVGFKGVGVTASRKLNKRCALSAEINKGNSKSMVNFGKFSVTRTLSPSVDTTFTLIEVWQDKFQRAAAIRGELFVKF